MEKQILILQLIYRGLMKVSLLILSFYIQLVFYFQPEYLVYHEIIKTKKSYMKYNTMIFIDWLGFLGTHLCTVSEGQLLHYKCH